MARSTKLAELVVNETSGVDHPAHLHEGWLVIKSQSDDQGADNVELDVTEISAEAEQISEDVTPVAASVSVDESLQKELTDLRKELMAMRVEKERLEQERELAASVEKASGWAMIPGVDPAEFGSVMLEVAKAAPAAAEKIAAVLDATATAMGEVDILKEVGAEAQDSMTADAWSTIETRANDLVAAGEASSFAKAITLVAERDKDLYNRYITEKGL